MLTQIVKVFFFSFFFPFICEDARAEKKSSFTLDTNGNTPLHLAVMKKDAKFVTKLLDLGAFLFLQNKDGRTPLVLARHMNLQNIVNLIVEYGEVSLLFS